MKKTTILSLLLLLGITGYSQKLSSTQGEGSIGLGIGLPYGGIGARFGYNAADHLNLFGGVGYNFVGVGFNAGLAYSFPSEAQTEFYLTGMYGYNAAILVDFGGSRFEEIYYGPSFGAGIKINSRKIEGNFWDISLIVPITSSDFKDMNDAFSSVSGLDYREAWPVLFSVGYNWNL